MSGMAGNIYTILVILLYFYGGVKLYDYYCGKKEEEKQPLREEIATVVAKRKKITPYGARRMMHGVLKKYYATFQFEDGQRVELEVYECQYEELVVGDIGHLHFQGKKCITFNVE